MDALPINTTSAQAISADMKQLPRLLRGGGILAILLSIYGFLVNGWQGSDDLTRFLMLLGHTLGLFGIGLLSGKMLKEGKGARILIMLSLISVVATFSVVGSFLYAEYGQSLNSDFLPALKWNLHNEFQVIALSLLVPGILVPVMLIGFRSLARGMHKKLTLLFFVSNGLLLLPIRDPMLVSMMAIGLAFYTLTLVIKSYRQRMESKTLEGQFALMMQFIPAFVLLVRNILLYGDNSILYAGVYFVGFVAIRQLCLMNVIGPALRTTLEAASVCLCLAIFVCLIKLLDSVALDPALMISLPTVISGILLLELSTRVTLFDVIFRNIAAVFITAGSLSSLLFNDSSLALVITMITAIALLAYSYLNKYGLMLLMAVILLITCFAKLSWEIWFVFDLNTWAISALAGVLAILAGSLLESKGRDIQQRLSKCRSMLTEWSF